MKKILKIFFVLSAAVILINSCLYSQGLDIKLKIEGVECDSIFLQTFDTKAGFRNLMGVPYSPKAEFKAKKPLKPGIYFLAADSTGMAEILISDEQNQKFAICFIKDSLYFIGSPENEANQDYMRHILAYEMQMQQLNDEFNQLTGSNMPSYMLQPYIDSLTFRAMQIAVAKKDLQLEVVRKNQGLLLASVVKSSIEIPTPPQECYRNQMLMECFVAEHLYDTYPWEDARMINTPIAVSRHKRFARLLYYIDARLGMPFLMKELEAAKANEEAYFHFFDCLDEGLNSKSEYCVEDLYLALLKDALAYEKTDNTRRVRCESELAHLDKNLAGSKLPNFNIELPDGTRTTLYDVPAPYMLLYFQHPECPTCSKAREMMKDYPILNEAVRTGKVVVLTVYFEDDKAVFEKFLKNEANPAWMHSWNYDHEIEDKELFYLARIPYMFLIDKDKKVIRKDILINEIEDYVKQLK